MGTGKINVWIAEIAKPCKISSNDWMVALADCESRLFEWCGKPYLFYARCGHVEISDVPPGTYIVVAARGIKAEDNIRYNFAAHHTIARVSCGEETCVTLYVPLYPECGVLLSLATRELMNREALPRETGQRLIQAIDNVLTPEIQRQARTQVQLLNTLFKRIKEEEAKAER